MMSPEFTLNIKYCGLMLWAASEHHVITRALYMSDLSVYMYVALLAEI